MPKRMLWGWAISIINKGRIQAVEEIVLYLGRLDDVWKLDTAALTIDKSAMKGCHQWKNLKYMYHHLRGFHDPYIELDSTLG